ncbi:TetR/AcrR family transcriptional regulator C-terminal ligand-binding domain-containing protein [Streptomyces sp. CB00455]|uniref:TetR/AcrR family transcriptional regulator C-terminal ligand-binding domain-containing protein n=1 Tax=Streptomyces sp. CB00455 TaxID=1703927 RepID=UPI001F5C081F|nr:TetR/AcrR family transcriptional regulator C-terminal ligand-binding domain-containing protein [Streptomyces sp. CB00455]
MGAAAETGAVGGQYAQYTARTTCETRNILERGIARGDVAPGTDVRAAATLVAAPPIFRLIGEQEMPDALSWTRWWTSSRGRSGRPADGLRPAGPRVTGRPAIDRRVPCAGAAG